MTTEENLLLKNNRKDQSDLD